MRTNAIHCDGAGRNTVVREQARHGEAETIEDRLQITAAMPATIQRKKDRGSDTEQSQKQQTNWFTVVSTLE